MCGKISKMENLQKSARHFFHNNSTSTKLKYLVTGAVLANVMPICIAIPSLWILAGIYSLPALLVEHFFHLQNVLAIDNQAIPLLSKLGFLIAFPFWAVIGACLGYLTFRIQAKNGQENLSPFQLVNRIGGTILAAIFIGYALVMAVASFTYK